MFSDASTLPRHLDQHVLESSIVQHGSFTITTRLDLGRGHAVDPKDDVDNRIPYPSPPMSDSSGSPSRRTVSDEADSSSPYARSSVASQGHIGVGRMSQPRVTTEYQGRSALDPVRSLGETRPGHTQNRSRQGLTSRQEHPYPFVLEQSHHHGLGRSGWLEAPTRLSTSQDARTQGLPIGTDPTRAAKTTRRTKAHVASACINCKRAHLSCDVQRPCPRCVATGKEDTCVDVQHKKRGRPRLRDERENDPENNTPRTVSGSYAQDLTEQAGAALQRTRYQRTDSSRDMRSHHRGHSGSSNLTDPGLFPLKVRPLHQPRLGMSHAITTLGSSQHGQAPLAFLNLDMTILRANGPFHRALCATQNLSRRNLRDLLASQEKDDLRALCALLREERDTRDPAYLPPLYGPDEYEAIQDVEESDVQRLSQGFYLRRVQMRFRLPDGQYQYITSQVQLARTSFYFVVLTLLQVGGHQEPSPMSSSFHARPANTTPGTAPAPYPYDRPSARSSVASSEAGSPPYALSTAATTPRQSRPDISGSPSQYTPSPAQGYFPPYHSTYDVRSSHTSLPGGSNPYMTAARPPRRSPPREELRQIPNLRLPPLPVGRYDVSGQPQRMSAPRATNRERTPERTRPEPDTPNGGRRRRRRLDIREVLE